MQSSSTGELSPRGFLGLAFMQMKDNWVTCDEQSPLIISQKGLKVCTLFMSIRADAFHFKLFVSVPPWEFCPLATQVIPFLFQGGAYVRQRYQEWKFKWISLEGSQEADPVSPEPSLPVIKSLAMSISPPSLFLSYSDFECFIESSWKTGKVLFIPASIPIRHRHLCKKRWHPEWTGDQESESWAKVVG